MALKHGELHLIMTNFHFSITLDVKALLVSMFSLNDFSFSHEKDTECTFGFALSQKKLK